MVLATIMAMRVGFLPICHLFTFMSSVFVVCMCVLIYLYLYLSIYVYTYIYMYMLVSQNRGTPIQNLKYYNPFDKDLQKGMCNFGKTHISLKPRVLNS